MTRRVALHVVGAVLGYMHGKPVADAPTSQTGVHGLSLVLDGLDGIVLQYRGQRVVISPAEIMAALQPEPTAIPRSAK